MLERETFIDNNWATLKAAQQIEVSEVLICDTWYAMSIGLRVIWCDDENKLLNDRYCKIILIVFFASEKLKFGHWK